MAIGTPSFDVSEIVRRVPAAHDYELGSTYLAGLERRLPSPIANRLFGTPDDTGAYVFRKILGFADPNVGFGFSLPSEGYLNFGFIGSFASALLLGVVLGFAFMRQVAPPRRALHLLYPMLVSTLPLAVRSDALGQIKWILYPSLIVAVILALSRTRSGTAPAGTSRSPALAPKGYRPRISAGIAAIAVGLSALALIAVAHQRGFHLGRRRVRLSPKSPAYRSRRRRRVPPVPSTSRPRTSGVQPMRAWSSLCAPAGVTPPKSRQVRRRTPVESTSRGTTTSWCFTSGIDQSATGGQQYGPPSDEVQTRVSLGSWLRGTQFLRLLRHPWHRPTCDAKAQTESRPTVCSRDQLVPSDARQSRS